MTNRRSARREREEKDKIAGSREMVEDAVSEKELEHRKIVDSKKK